MRVLDAGNGYATTYEYLPDGALCGIAETDDGGADAAQLRTSDGEVVPLVDLDSDSTEGWFAIASGEELSFELENSFDAPLPPTGSDARGLLIAAGVAGVLLLIGAGLLVVLRRRRAAD